MGNHPCHAPTCTESAVQRRRKIGDRGWSWWCAAHDTKRAAPAKGPVRAAAPAEAPVRAAGPAKGPVRAAAPTGRPVIVTPSPQIRRPIIVNDWGPVTFEELPDLSETELVILRTRVEAQCAEIKGQLEDAKNRKRAEGLLLRLACALGWPFTASARDLWILLTRLTQSPQQLGALQRLLQALAGGQGNGHARGEDRDGG